MWDPDVYLAFSGHRNRPFYELVSRVGLERARRVVDLGCGARPPDTLPGTTMARRGDRGSGQLTGDGRCRGRTRDRRHHR